MFGRQTFSNVADRNVRNRADVIPYSTCQAHVCFLHRNRLSERPKTLRHPERVPVHCCADVLHSLCSVTWALSINIYVWSFQLLVGVFAHLGKDLQSVRALL